MKKEINYTKTINLPKINFPMKANLKQKEILILKKWNKLKLYYEIRKNKINKNKFYLHDGPPFANGNIHIGHALNKILKDIIIKVKNYMNMYIEFIPGWDCHGLPIELEIQKNQNKKIKTLSQIINFKKKCKIYVKKQIKKQKNDFIRLGILADWNNNYKTMNYKIISKTINIFKKIIKLNLLERKEKPIYWCINCKSSLSESEIEYKNKESNSLYILFKINNNIIKNNKKKIFFVIWTTTTWTIPGNCAIAIHPNIIYSFYESKNKIILISKKLKNNFFKNIKIKYKEKYNIKGKYLKNLFAIHPISKKKIPIIFNKNIKEKKGTGIVHIASQHGEEDFYLSKKYKIKGLNLIDNNGLYINYPYIKDIYGCTIQKAEKYIIKKLKNYIIVKKKIIHKYPFCWRHKIFLIFKTTPQWFINIKKNIKEKILKTIKLIKWIPLWGYKKIKKMINNRPDWCISRQRFWGTPLTIFINKKTKKIHPKTIEIINYIIPKIKKYGPNYWLNLSKKKILGKEENNYEKVLDTLDVWFDSGSTCFSVINKKFEKKNNYIDLCIEGSDQYRGWFMSSLLIHTIINNGSPFKKILSHGFTVDENGKKMSKSLKNYIKPQKIINKFGSDIIRLWVASTNFNNEIKISNKIIEKTTELYRKIRNTIKFLISNLENFKPDINSIKKNNLLIIDKWIIHKTKKKQEKIIKLFNKFKFNFVTKEIINFCVNYLSSIYCDVIKDRKYTIKKNTIPFYSAQTTMWLLVNSIVKWISPILSFTAEEIWNYIPGKKEKSVFLGNWFNKLFFFKENEKKYISIINTLIKIKKKINKLIEEKIKKKIINSSLEIKIIIYTNKKFIKKIKNIKNELKYFFIVSDLDIKENNNINLNENNNFKIEYKKLYNKKCLRCWNYVKKIKNNICYRCIENIYGKGENRIFV